MACLATTTFDFNAIKAENDTLGHQEDADDYDPQQFAANAALTPEAQAALEQARKEAEEAERLLAEMEAGLDDHHEEVAKHDEQWTTATTTKPEAEISLTDAIVGKAVWERSDGDDEENLEHGKVVVPVVEPKKKAEEKSAWETCFKPADLEDDNNKEPEVVVEEEVKKTTEDVVEEQKTSLEEETAKIVQEDEIVKEESKDDADKKTKAIADEGIEKFDWAAERRRLLAKNRKKSVRRTKSMRKPSEAGELDGEQTEEEKKRRGVRRSKSTVL